MKSNTNKILNFLRKAEKATPTEIHLKTKIPFYMVKWYLEKLEQKGLIEKEEKQLTTEGVYTYWRLKE